MHSFEDLDAILVQDECYNCGAPLQCTVGDCMFQPLTGEDYVFGGNKASIICQLCGLGNYVTEICLGEPSEYKLAPVFIKLAGFSWKIVIVGFVCGEYHNHCVECPGTYGECTSSTYDSKHCSACSSHYKPTPANFPCLCNYKYK